MRITFNGQNLLCLHDFAEADAPQLHAQRTQFAGIWGESTIILGVGGRDLKIPVWLTDAGFVSASALDQYRQVLDLSVGTTANLQITDSLGNQLAYYADVTFEGYSPSDKIRQVVGVGMPAGTFWQPGTLHFHQNSVP